MPKQIIGSKVAYLFQTNIRLSSREVVRLGRSSKLCQKISKPFTVLSDDLSKAIMESENWIGRVVADSFGLPDNVNDIHYGVACGNGIIFIFQQPTFLINDERDINDKLESHTNSEVVANESTILSKRSCFWAR
ncbi:hypothetical protein ES332_D02G118300v1 [Gossypium tomentosum]|uniref:Uncharacterized protein n=1 Tax=Gossypium tomentosum TaxID=34277 RepID=A0A5D2LW10_GOSTO|nr:hypothetical protein ES332_D02G118300v1 [Gossypium tomentosum]